MSIKSREPQGFSTLLMTEKLPPSLDTVHKGSYFDVLVDEKGPKFAGALTMRHLVEDWKLDLSLSTARIANRIAADSSAVMNQPKGIQEYTQGVLELRNAFLEAGYIPSADDTPPGLGDYFIAMCPRP